MTNKNFSKEEEKIIWASTRSVLELDTVKHKKNGKRSQSHWSTFEKLLKIVSVFLKISGLQKLGEKNALDIKKKNLELKFKDLPKSFDGFTILHLTDLHIDSLEKLPDAILKAIGNEKYDVCLITGDYRFQTDGRYQQVIDPLKQITSKIETSYGILGILGNHDTFRLVNNEDELQMRFLVNESFVIKKGDQRLVISGTDDPFKYFTQAATDTFDEKQEGFKIALVHTTELAENASQNGYQLYLCGHTHAGQICLPGGIPLITHQYEGKKFYNGLWQINGMTGYTSPGCGVSGIPIRFFSRGEVTKIVLKCN